MSWNSLKVSRLSSVCSTWFASDIHPPKAVTVRRFHILGTSCSKTILHICQLSGHRKKRINTSMSLAIGKGFLIFSFLLDRRVRNIEGILCMRKVPWTCYSRPHRSRDCPYHMRLVMGGASGVPWVRYRANQLLGCYKEEVYINRYHTGWSWTTIDLPL